MKKKQPEAICVTLKDQLGSVYAVVSMQRRNVLESTYVATKGILQIVFASRRMEGRDEMVWLEVERGKRQGQSIVGEPTGAFKQEKMYYTSEQPNLLDISEEAEIRKVWEWLDNGVPADDLFKMREDTLKKLEEFKLKKQAEAEENKKKAEAEKEAAGVTAETKDQQEIIDAIKKNGIPVEEDASSKNMHAVKNDEQKPPTVEL